PARERPIFGGEPLVVYRSTQAPFPVLSGQPRLAYNRYESVVNRLNSSQVNLASGPNRQLRDVFTLVNLEATSRESGVREVEQKPAARYLNDPADHVGQIRGAQDLPIKIVDILNDY